MRISDWSSDVCSSDLFRGAADGTTGPRSVKKSALRCGYPCLSRSRPGAARAGVDGAGAAGQPCRGKAGGCRAADGDRQSVVEGNSVSARVGPGGGRCIKETKQHSKERTMLVTH